MGLIFGHDTLHLMGIEGHEHAASLLNRYNVVRALTDEETGKVKVYVRSKDDAR